MQKNRFNIIEVFSYYSDTIRAPFGILLKLHLMNRLFVDNLTVIDFSYLHIERGIVGESWIVDVELQGELDEQGMVFDFGDVKKQIKSIIDNEVDHKFVIPVDNEHLAIRRKEALLEVCFQSADGSKMVHCSPQEAITQINDTSINKDNVSAFLCQIILERLPENVTGISINLREESIQSDYYHYSHGLKKHKGNCQRIAHGHRSKIEIFKDGVRDYELERRWATTFKDIYIGTKEDLVNQVDINHIAHCEFAYKANQGEFSLTLPAHQVYLINTDSTVEWIATHIAEMLKQEHSNHQIRVKAFEGVGKGAIAER